jgi:hypothetical protein
MAVPTSHQKILAFFDVLLRLVYLEYMRGRRTVVEILDKFLKGSLIALSLSFDLDAISIAKPSA